MRMNAYNQQSPKLFSISRGLDLSITFILNMLKVRAYARLIEIARISNCFSIGATGASLGWYRGLGLLV